MGSRERYASATALGVVLAVVLGLALGCAAAPAFVCGDSDDCRDGSFTGVCQDNGYCSFGDPECDSGQRFGEHAPGDLAGACVDPAGTSSGSTSTDGDATTFTSLDGASLEQGTTPESSTDGSTSAAESTTGMPIDDTTGGGNMSTSDPSDTGLDTMIPPECWLPTDNGCSTCVAESCCDEALDCMMDPECACYYQCVDAMIGMPEIDCLEFCGTSPVLEILDACLTENCAMICSAS
ncbi:MAG TPA: hypothetical protein VFG69_20070 [Nannocystaceae bacterium]|nr:hypothetical protein [Nannocystaceae bacterium]